MSVDVDAVNERLNGLVTLLQAVGVDSLEKNDLERVKNFSKSEMPGALPDARQLNDDQIEAIIKKLQQAQAEAPQIIAALEAHAEARSLTGGTSRSQQQRQPQPPPPQEEEEEEDDDEFDEDANYPMVGAGCSDDISVVSDLTTPTVLTGVPVPEEEHYRETLPPMIVGGGGDNAPPMMIQPTKRKNLVNQVRPGHGHHHHGNHVGAIPPPGRRNVAPAARGGGAAASRRKNYQETMAKLHENPCSMGFVGPTAAPSPSAGKKPSKKSSSSGKQKRSTGKSSSSKPNPNGRSSASSNRDFDAAAWNAFDAPAAGRSGKGKSSTPIDNNGFLVGDGFDPFGCAGDESGESNPFRSSAGDLAGSSHRRGGFSSTHSDDGAGGGPGPRRPARKGDGKRPQGAAGRKAPSGSGNGPRRRGRRASLAM